MDAIWVSRWSCNVFIIKRCRDVQNSLIHLEGLFVVPCVRFPRLYDAVTASSVKRRSVPAEGQTARLCSMCTGPPFDLRRHQRWLAGHSQIFWLDDLTELWLLFIHLALDLVPNLRKKGKVNNLKFTYIRTHAAWHGIIHHLSTILLHCYDLLDIFFIVSLQLPILLVIIGQGRMHAFKLSKSILQLLLCLLQLRLLLC